MIKVRVHELAKLLDTNSKELIGLLAEYGYVIKNHMTVLEDDQLDVILEVFTKRYNKAVEIPDFGKQKPKAAPKKDGADAKDEEKQPEPQAEEEVPAEVVDEPIKRKVRHVDTRQTVVDVNKMDTEKLEEMVPTNVADDGVKKQKLKKGANRHRDNNMNNKAKQQQPAKEQKVKKEK